MAYMSQQKKKEIAVELKKVMPCGWKYSLGVDHHSTLVLTISQAPVDLVAEYAAHAIRRGKTINAAEIYANAKSISCNPYWFEDQFEGERLDQMLAIRSAMNSGNHDRSDISTDYFDVGWYIDINFGRGDKPFRVIKSEEREAA